MPGMPGMPGMPPPRASDFIIFCASLKRSSSWLTSETVTPEPLAMRARREPLICLGWVRSNGVIERTIASTRSNSRVVEGVELARIIWPMPGIIPSIDLSEPIFLMAAICCEEVVEGEVLLGEELARHLVGLARVERLLGLLDERQHVAHVEDARGHPVGVEDLEVLDASRRSRRT